MMTDRTHEEVCKLVFDALIAINVNEHTEKKGNLTYLSWAWAYVEIMKRYPTFNYRFDETVTENDGTVTVNCTTQITVDGHDVVRTMWLPVMDYRNKAITHPDSMALNTARMRCLTKCISMHGLGAYIYAGEDLPEAPVEDRTATPKKKATPKPKAVPKAVPKAPAPEATTSFDIGDESCDINDDVGAEYVVDQIINLATNMHSNNMDNLVSFWQKNANVVSYLTKNYPDESARLKATFTKIKTRLIGDNK
jgi:hypothetical protein